MDNVLSVIVGASIVVLVVSAATHCCSGYPSETQAA